MIIIKLYLLLCLLVIVHELAHYLFLKLFKVRFDNLVIGNFIYLKIGFVQLSPFIFSGHITYDAKQFAEQSLAVKSLIVSSGLIANLFVYLLIPETSYLAKHLALLYVLVIATPLPLLKSDTYLLLKFMVEHVKKK